MMRQLTIPPSFDGWQKAARRTLAASIKPEDLLWHELGSDQPLLEVAEEAEFNLDSLGPARVPKAFMEVAHRVACHSSPQRWALLYRVLWRLTHGEPQLLQIVVDADIQTLMQMDKAIRHDVHKMRAFVRFREVQHEDAKWFVAWFEPSHHIVELNAPFFVDRFANMCWSILTPERCVHWNGSQLSFTNGVPKSEAPTDDATESLWIKYYSHIFNPARVKTRAMQKEMPKRYWKNLPESSVIPALLHDASSRVQTMMAKSNSKKAVAGEFSPAPVPATDDVEVLRQAASKCTACPLYKEATQTVFGEGSPRSKLVFLGEQPGDSEDREGHPFIGPAGQLLHRALEEAGIDRKIAYVTNAVKHFKWEPSGKRRLHKTPNAREVAACRPWLEAELKVIAPKVLVCLGGTAAKSVLGGEVRVLRDRGKFIESPFSRNTFITVHPSSLLRAPDEESRARDYAKFVGDLRMVAEHLKQHV